MRVSYRFLLLSLVSMLLLPVHVQKAEAQAIPLGNHYKCYEILDPPVITFNVNLSDQFGVQNGQSVRPRYLCNPVKKNGSAVPNPNLHYVCYDLVVPVIPLRSARVTNQFGTLDVRVQQAKLLCLPSSKILLAAASASPEGGKPAATKTGARRAAPSPR